MAIERFDPSVDKVSFIAEEHLARYNFAKKFAGGKVVLDIACGTGYGSDILASSGAKQVIGLDNSAVVIKEAGRKYQSSNLKFFTGEASKINWSDNYFDLVVSFETIEHLANYRQFLEEIYRVLKKDGLLIISTPNRHLVSCYLIYRHPFNKFHKIEFSKNQFINIIKKKFAILDIYGQRTVSKLLTPYLIRKPLEKIFKIIDLLLEQKIYGQADGPSIRKIGFLKEATYFVIIAKKITNKSIFR